MTITQEMIEARRDEVNRIFRENIRAVIDDKWQFYSGVCKVDEASDEQYPLVAEVRVDTVKPMDTEDVNFGMGTGGGYAVVEWLIGLGVIDGTVDVRINSVQVNDGL